jgi:hypothetical protein
MKIASIVFVVSACLFIGIGDADARDGAAVDQAIYDDLSQTTFTPLFDALRGGDLASLKRFLEPDVYEQYRVLFEQNGQYDQFLRDYYANTDFELGDVAPVDGGYLAQVTIHWPDGHSAITQWHVTENSAKTGPRQVSPATAD